MFSTTMSPVLLGILVLCPILLYLRDFYSNTKRRGFPPGPRGLPIVGHLFSSPQGVPWLEFSRMAQKHGDILHLKVLNQHTIIISSTDAVSDLLEKRSTNYSDRFYSVMLSELMGMDWSFGRMNYGEEWRQKRKIFHHYYSASAVQNYEGIILENVHRFLVRLHDHPENFFGHARFVFAAMLLNVTYGITIEDESNEYLLAAEAWQHGFNQAILPGRFWVDYFPLLKYIPTWFPGATFKRLAAKWRANMYKARDHTFNLAKAKLENGTATPCVVTAALEGIEESENRTEKERLIRHSIATAFGAGVDTSAPTLQMFFYAMLSHPEVQKKGQEELQRVVGLDRLPAMDDRPKLPYIEAILKELLRWNPVTPLALPHYTAAEDEYRGYHIPEGSIVLGNAWHILHDPSQYPDPDQFRPERFLQLDGTLNDEIMDPSVACFGFGRRICPGRYLSLNALFATISCTLHTFDISPAVDENGEPEIRELCMQPGMICHPEPFPCIIQLRPHASAILEKCD